MVLCFRWMQMSWFELLTDCRMHHHSCTAERTPVSRNGYRLSRFVVRLSFYPAAVRDRVTNNQGGAAKWGGMF